MEYKICEWKGCKEICGLTSEMGRASLCKKHIEEGIKKYNIKDGPASQVYAQVIKAVRKENNKNDKNSLLKNKITITNKNNKEEEILRLKKRIKELEENINNKPKIKTITRKDAYPVTYSKTPNGSYYIRIKLNNSNKNMNLFSLPKEMKEEKIIKYCIKIKESLLLSNKKIILVQE